MLVIKTLILDEHSPSLDRRAFEVFTAETARARYGSDLHGIRYENVVIEVPESKRDDEYDMILRRHRAAQGFYDEMRRTDERYLKVRDIEVKRLSIEEVRKIAGGGLTIERR